MKYFKLFENFMTEAVRPTSGVGAAVTYELEHAKYEIKKPIKVDMSFSSGGHSAVELPKGTIVVNLPGGTFAQGDKLKKEYGKDYDDRWGMMIIRTPDAISAIEAAGKPVK